MVKFGAEIMERDFARKNSDVLKGQETLIVD
jgi:hypothetical protein